MRYTAVFEWPDGQEPRVGPQHLWLEGVLCAVQFSDALAELAEQNERVEKLEAENAALTAKVERLTARGIQDLQHENAALREQIAQVKADAYEDIESWAGYASAYFQEKHDLEGCLKKYLTQEQKDD